MPLSAASMPILALVSVAALPLASAQSDTCGDTIRDVLTAANAGCLPSDSYNTTEICDGLTSGSESLARCEWAVQMAYINYLGAVYNTCGDTSDSTTTPTPSPPTPTPAVATPVEDDTTSLCATESAPFVQCLESLDVNKTQTAASAYDESTCSCVGTFYAALLAVADCNTSVVLPLLPDSSTVEYYDAKQAVSTCSGAIVCAFPPAEVVESSDAFQVLINSTDVMDEDVLQAAIASAARVSSYQVVIFLQTIDMDGWLIVWFKLVSLDAGTVQTHVEALNSTLLNESSYLRKSIQMQSEMTVVDNPFSSVYTITTVEKEDEVPDYMIALLIIFGVIILIGIGAAAVVFLGGSSDSEEEGYEDGEMGEKDYEEGAEGGAEHPEQPKALPEN